MGTEIYEGLNAYVKRYNAGAAGVRYIVQIDREDMTKKEYANMLAAMIKGLVVK